MMTSDKIKSVLVIGHNVRAGVWIRGKFKQKIDRSVKTPWQGYGVVAGSWRY